MDGGSLLHSEHCGGGVGNNTERKKMVKGDSEGGAPNKILGDITNLQQQCLKSSNQHLKQESASLTSNNCIDKLITENAMLMKLLANRNAAIESSKAEIDKLQSNFQKLKKQNSQLALVNSQMLAEVNSSRQMLRELQLELACKNGMLQALKLESMGTDLTSKLTDEVAENKVEISKNKQLGHTFQTDKRVENICNVKRRRASTSSVPAVIEQSNPTEKVDTQRNCLRQQSARFKAEKPGPTGNLLEVDNISKLNKLENLVNENGLATSGATVPEETREYNQSLEPTDIEQVHDEEKISKKRRNLKRQSSRFKPENPEPIEDMFEIDDKKFPVFPLCDDKVVTSGLITSSATSEQESKGRNNAYELDLVERRRSSVGRPLRRAAEKVQTYKELPLKVKLRRPESTSTSKAYIDETLLSGFVQ